MNQLETKISELKSLVSQFETLDFLQHVSLTIMRIGERETSPLFKNLLSPHRQLFYLASLHLETTQTDKKIVPSEKEWHKMTELLRDIELYYIDHIWQIDNLDSMSEEEKDKVTVALPTFMNYFFNGSLSYLEQITERIRKTFYRYDDKIKEKFHLSIDDFLECFEFIEKEANAKFNSPVEFIKNSKWQDFTSQMISNGISDPKDWIKRAPVEIRELMENSDFIDSMKNPGRFLIFDIENLINQFDSDKLLNFLTIFSCNKEEREQILYYTDANILLNKPIYKINSTKFFVFHINQTLSAIYEKLYQFCNDLTNGKIHLQRDKFLEQKTKEIFENFFPKDAKIFTSYNVDGHSEQDLIVIYKSSAFIVEIKAANSRAPLRDPYKAYDKIKSDFKKSIQYGFDQTNRVFEKFDSNEPFDVRAKNKKILTTINPRKFNNVFSIIVTLDRFGIIQSNLEYLLQIDDYTPFPWAVNIDDLESFLLLLKKRGGHLRNFFTFLTNRELLHGHNVAADELDICCMFFDKPKQFIEYCNKEDTIVFREDWTNVLTREYNKGLGFKNERYWKQKKDGTTKFIFT
ncbi:hypothetical protein [uncultured Draconibacterium sp.]|uniref:hypothetical protein n=1 Tax=uncultured Draconibacterium sp. TaxID=1573823 RepID=UPI0032168F2A